MRPQTSFLRHIRPPCIASFQFNGVVGFVFCFQHSFAPVQMLVRSAGRKQRRNTSQILAASFAQLNLPFLAPAQLRWSATHTTTASTRQTKARTPRSSLSLAAKAQARSLATAADQYTPRTESLYGLGAYRNAVQEQHVPWDFSKATPPSKVSNLRPYSDPIIINTSISSPEARAKARDGISGNSVDLLQHLHTCLRVGRLSRAESIIQRLAQQCLPDAPEMTHAHTAYLEESLRTLAEDPVSSARGQGILADMQKWFEVEVRSKGVSLDARILVVMIRATIRALDGSKRDRTVRRYAEIARESGQEVYDEVMYSEEYDDNEFTIFGRATSDLYGQDRQLEEQELKDEQDMDGHTDTTQSTERVLRQTIADEELPDVRPVDQKGLGLDAVKKSLETFRKAAVEARDGTSEEQMERAYDRQHLMEETAIEIAIERWRIEDEQLRKIGINTAMQTKPIGALMWQWYQTLLPALEEELKEVKKVLSSSRRDEDRLHYGPYLELLPLHKVAATAILYTISKMNQGKDWNTQRYEHEAKINALTMGLGKTLEQESKIDARGGRVKYSGLGRAQRTAQQSSKHANKAGRAGKGAKFAASKAKREALASLEWPSNVKVKLGAMLVAKLMETAQIPVTREHPRTREKITQIQPAFMHKIKYTNGKKTGLVSPNPAVVKKIQSEPVGALIAKRLPMIVEPRPWTAFDQGGYLNYSTPILRLGMGDKSGKDYFVAAQHKGDTKQIFAGLNALSKIPWKIHLDVFKVQLEAWNSGERIANFAPLNPKLDVPPEPEPSTDPGPRRRWLAECRDVENRRAGYHSQRCFQNFQMEIARAVLNETLYFPHSMDFRGRAYPIPPYLNHMGADNARGMLVFGNGKELGAEGLTWLKIHLANVAGYDKASLKEREDFTMKHLDDIYDSVRNPLGGRRWWLESEDAWQTLAACFELTSALDSPDPTKYVSCLPIQQDGTCNGLQHYAALGGDKIGAAQVNLEPSDRPADIYTAVAEHVKEEVKQDAESGNPIAQKLHGRITRKVVKQPVMTNVYGVTYFGAKEQVQRQLEELFPDVRRFDAVNHKNMAQYIATKIFKSLGSMFTGAQAIQHWLGACADRISTCLTPEQIAQLTKPEEQEDAGPKPKRGARKITVKIEDEKDQYPLGTSQADRAQLKNNKPLFKSTVIWTTPLRLPVVQPYRTTNSRVIATSLQQISLHEPQVWDPVSKRKQLQAFPPNFIHSLDATHMLLSALKCNEIGMSFASIHDSFWTHACDVTAMSSVLRDAFVAMHSENIIGRLREEFQARYKGCMYLAAVYAKSPVGQKITEIRRSDTFNSQAGELACEVERLRLLESEDAEERDRGEQMVTPGSIMAAEADEAAFHVPREISSHILGEIPESSEGDEHNMEAADAADSATDDEGVVGGSVLGTDTQALADSASDVSQHVDDAPPAVNPKRNSKRVYHRKMYVWLPLTFPEVPEKGGFDVTRLRQSKYFFH